MSQLEEFHPLTDLPPDFMMIMYGMRRTGKTTALMTMLESMNSRFEKHKVFVFTGTGDDNPLQWKNFPLSSVNTDISNIDRSIGEIIENQRSDIKEEVKRQISAKNMNASRNPPDDGKKVDKEESREAFEASKGKKKRKNGKDDDGKKKKKKRNARGNEEKEKEGVSVVPVEPDKGPDNDLDRFPGELRNMRRDDRPLTDADIMRIRRDGNIDDSTMPHVLVILDDVVNDSSIRHSPNLNKLAVSGRHLFITAIILSQCVCGSGSVPPAIRINSDYVLVVGNPRSKNERQLLLEQYLSISNERANGLEGLRIMADVTRVKFRILAINVASSTATHFRDYLYKYGPVPSPPDNVSEDFRMGTEKQWEADVSGERKPAFTNSDFLKDPPKAPNLQAIDSGRFSVGHRSGIPGDVHVSKGIDRFVSRQAEFLDPFF